LHFVHSNEGINALIDNDARTFANHEDVMKDYWVRALTVNEKASLSARNHCIVSENKDVFI
jgi:hypothetical protein